MSEFWQEAPRYVALLAGLGLLGWGMWCTLTWVKGDWQRLRRWFGPS